MSSTPRYPVCRLCHRPMASHEPGEPVDGEPAIWECPDRSGYVTPDQFELWAIDDDDTATELP